jgi:hypothetical protein
VPALSVDSRRLIAAVVSRLGIKPEWTVEDPAGVGFVAAELGTWLTVQSAPSGPRWLIAEVRLARQVPDTGKTLAFVDGANHWSFHGRWVYDPASASVAVVSGLDLDAVGAADPVELSAVMVATMISSVERYAYLSRPQRSLDAGKALTLVGGRRRGRADPVAGFVWREAVPRGRQPGAAAQVLILVQDCLVPELLGWCVEHDRHQSLAIRGDGRCLVLRVLSHPWVGHGLMIAVAGEPFDGTDEEAARRLAALNRARPGSPGLAGWNRVENHLELRAFLPNALLECMNTDTMDLSPVLAQIHSIIGQVDAARPVEADADHRGSVLLKPAWPGDGEAAVLARRDPINDGPDAPDSLVWVDRLDRPAHTTADSFRRWRERLTNEDLADPSVTGFIDWFHREHERRHSLPRTLEDDLRLYAEHIARPRRQSDGP